MRIFIYACPECPQNIREKTHHAPFFVSFSVEKQICKPQTVKKQIHEAKNRQKVKSRNERLSKKHYPKIYRIGKTAPKIKSRCPKNGHRLKSRCHPMRFFLSSMRSRLLSGRMSIPAKRLPIPWTKSQGSPEIIQSTVCRKSNPNIRACAGA